MNTNRTALDNGHIDVDTFADHVELTARINDRTVFGIALTFHEAEHLGLALARPDGPTVSDLYAIADISGLDASQMIAGAR
jgi:hypothetical protein